MGDGVCLFLLIHILATPLTCYPQRRNPHINTQTRINQASKSTCHLSKQQHSSKILQRRFPSSRKQVRTARFPSCCSSMGGASTTPLPHTARMCACTRVIHRVLCSYPAVLGVRGLLFPAPKMTPPPPHQPSLPPDSLPRTARTNVLHGRAEHPCALLHRVGVPSCAARPFAPRAPSLPPSNLRRSPSSTH